MYSRIFLHALMARYTHKKGEERANIAFCAYKSNISSIKTYYRPGNMGIDLGGANVIWYNTVSMDARNGKERKRKRGYVISEIYDNLGIIIIYSFRIPAYKSYFSSACTLCKFGAAAVRPRVYF